MSRILGIIPARMGSTRFPGKPLAMIQQKPMIQWVWENCQKSKYVKNWVVATDHLDIFNSVIEFGGEALMTHPDHASGTDRCIEAFEKGGANYSHFINVQGDEPLVSALQIDALAQKLVEQKVQIATLIKKNDSWEDFQNKNRVKVVVNIHGQALYFSRAGLPSQTQEQFSFFWKHIGMYGFSVDVISQLKKMTMGYLEKTESLEQLRWLENGLSIQTTETELETPSVDAPEDLDTILKYLSNKI